MAVVGDHHYYNNLTIGTTANDTSFDLADAVGRYIPDDEYVLDPANLTKGVAIGDNQIFAASMNWVLRKNEKMMRLI